MNLSVNQVSTIGSVLVLEDDGAIRMVVTHALRRAGHHVTSVGTVSAFERELSANRPDVVVTDVGLPDGNGLEVAASLAQSHADLPVIILSAQNTLTTAVRATAVGAYEYLPKPFDLDTLTRAVAGALTRQRGVAVDPPIDEDHGLPLIGRSPAMQDVYRVIARVVANDLTILILGESGTGKELVARAIHDLGPRRQAPFVAINMAAIPRELIEADLFGYERGAFTGAHGRSSGRFEQADGGTLFLDEIGDMPMEAQTRLLRVLQSGEFTTLGGMKPVRVDVRIVAATNRDLQQLVRLGLFREDLFYRLNVVPIALPALRERRSDVALLARHFLASAASDGLPRRQLDAAAVMQLEAYDWPGNVRELENLMRRLAVLSRDEVIGADDLHGLLNGSPSEASIATFDFATAVRAWLDRITREEPDLLENGKLHDRLVAEVERPLIEVILARHAGNQLRAAHTLGINRNTLRKRLDELNIVVDRG